MESTEEIQDIQKQLHQLTIKVTRWQGRITEITTQVRSVSALQQRVRILETQLAKTHALVEQLTLQFTQTHRSPTKPSKFMKDVKAAVADFT